MTITRIFQEGWEWSASGVVGSLPWITVDSPPGQTTDFYTGGYALGFTTSSEGLYYLHSSAITQIRMSMMWKTDTMSTGTNHGLFFLASGTLSTPVIHIYYAHGTNTWSAYAGATLLDSAVFDIEDQTWRHFAFDAKIDSASGWLSFYIDGVEILSYTGKTDHGDTDFDIIGIGPISSTYSNWNSGRGDDIYFDDTTGEVAAAPPPLKRFYPLLLDGNGNYAQWHGSDGDQTDNYQLIDSNSSLTNIESDGAIESATSGHRDSWTLAATPAGITGATTIPALIVVGTVFRRALSGIQVRLFCRYSATDSDSDAITPPLDWGGTTWRFTSPPGGGSWTKTIVDATEIGIKFE